MGSGPQDDFVVHRNGAILHMTWKPGTSIDAPTAQAALDAFNENAIGGSCLLLLDITGMVHVSHEARKILAQPSAARRIAVIGGGPVEEMLVSYQARTKDLPCPTRYFESLTEATGWLNEGP